MKSTVLVNEDGNCVGLESPWKQTSGHVCEGVYREGWLKCADPPYSQSSSQGSRPREKENTGAQRLSTSVHLTLLPGCPVNVTKRFGLLHPASWMPVCAMWPTALGCCGCLDSLTRMDCAPQLWSKRSPSSLGCTFQVPYSDEKRDCRIESMLPRIWFREERLWSIETDELLWVGPETLHSTRTPGDGDETPDSGWQGITWL